jgi:hypothetical protein
MNQDWQKKLIDFWLKYEVKIVLIIGFVLIAAISFEGGYLRGKSIKNNPIVIEKATAEAQNCDSGANIAKPGQIDQNTQNNKKECLFMASKNSKKFHVSSCRFAKNIKPENIICFSSKEEAIQKGFQPDATCIK